MLFERNIFLYFYHIGYFLLLTHTHTHTHTQSFLIIFFYYSYIHKFSICNGDIFLKTDKYNLRNGYRK